MNTWNKVLMTTSQPP